MVLKNPMSDFDAEKSSKSNGPEKLPWKREVSISMYQMSIFTYFWVTVAFLHLHHTKLRMIQVLCIFTGPKNVSVS